MDSVAIAHKRPLFKGSATKLHRNALARCALWSHVSVRPYVGAFALTLPSHLLSLQHSEECLTKATDFLVIPVCIYQLSDNRALPPHMAHSARDTCWPND